MMMRTMRKEVGKGRSLTLEKGRKTRVKLPNQQREGKRYVGGGGKRERERVL